MPKLSNPTALAPEASPFSTVVAPLAPLVRSPNANAKGDAVARTRLKLSASSFRPDKPPPLDSFGAELPPPSFSAK